MHWDIVEGRLREEGFFKQVFIDNGAAAWPGEIDLAPDAIYAEIFRRRENAELLVEGR